MGVVILKVGNKKRELLVCTTYDEALEWVSAHGNEYSVNGVLYPLAVEERSYAY